MKHTPIKMLTLSLLLLSLFACEKDKVQAPGDTGTFYGPVQSLGNGTARAFITVNNSGQPVEIGFAISETAMNSLPAGDEMLDIPLELPAKAAGKTPFKFLGLDYNPHGHEPDGVYNVPHFDFHFYKMTNAERLAIAPGDPKLDVLPAAAYLPEAHFAGGGVPQMGNHWIDPASPELNGQPFTTTFLYGSYDGKVTFMEPMITVDFLKNTAHLHSAVKQAQQFSPAGNYPTTYDIRHNTTEKQYEVTLEDFVARTAD